MDKVPLEKQYDLAKEWCHYMMESSHASPPWHVKDQKADQQRKMAILKTQNISVMSKMIV